jgi:HflC protein
VSYERIDKGRRLLSQDMLVIARELAPEYGIEILDIIPRQIRYSDELTESVYNRMIAERSQIAQAFRSFGEGKKAEWLGKLENEQRSILSKAYESAETLKGYGGRHGHADIRRRLRPRPRLLRFLAGHGILQECAAEVHQDPVNGHGLL